MSYEAHPIADVFPQMSGEDYARLVGDIDARGLLEPVWLYDGRILDGRHRYKACVELGLEPEFRTFEGDEDEAMLMSLSLNLARRHMTTEQRAALGVSIKAWEAARAEERMCAGVTPDPMEKVPQGPARDLAGARVGVNGKYVDAAERIREEAPDVFEHMQRGAYGSMANATKATRFEPEVRAKVHEKMGEGVPFKEAVRTVFNEPEGDINCTPREWVELARAVMGGIDLDPATNAAAQEFIQAGGFYTREDDGLERPWFGRVWCNPPYSGGLIERFAAKALAEFERGGVEQMLILTNASLSSEWWRDLAAASTRVATAKARISFWQPHAEQATSNPHNQTLFYFGDDPYAFERGIHGRGLGLVFEYKEAR